MSVSSSPTASFSEAPIVPSSPVASPAPVSGAAVVRNIRLLRYGSLALLGGYVLATCYKVGLVRRVLPTGVNRSLESAVESIKKKTQPIGDAARFASVRSHLSYTYGLAASGMVAVAAGVVTFWAAPSIPIAIPVATTIFPAVLVVGIPKAYMQPAARLLCFFLSMYSTGYACGPVGWVAQDTLVIFVLLSGCTMAGLCIPLYLTRGMVSYVVSAQVLSSALSVALITAPKQTSSSAVLKRFKDQAGVQIILNGDINVLFTMQLLSNVGICALHTLPTMYRFVKWKGEDEAELAASVDPVMEAFAICAGTMYVVYRAVRWSCRLLIRRVLSDNRHHPNGGAGQNTWLAMANPSSNVDRASGVVSGLVMGLWYIRAVSLLQRGDVETTLNRLRSVCARISPMGALLGSGTAGRYVATSARRGTTTQPCGMPGLNPASSFAAHSFREVTHHVYSSAVISVPATVVVKTLRNIESIKHYGADGGVIGACVMENLVDPTDVGAVRRCTLRLPPYADKLVREKLARYTEHRPYASGDPHPSEDVDTLASVEMTLEYLPCEASERHRSPFEPAIEAALHSCQTHIRVTTITRTPHRCVVEMDAECVLRLHQGRHVAAEVRLQDKACERAVAQFWQRYLDAQLSALERQVSKEAYPEVQTRMEVDYRRAFAEHEQLLCDWAVEGSDAVPRHVVLEELEQVMVWWARALESYKQQKAQTEIAEARVERVDSSPFTLTRPLSRRYTEAERQSVSVNAATTTASSPTRRLSEAVSRVGGEDGEGSNQHHHHNNVSEAGQASQSGMDVGMPGFRLPRSFMNGPESPSGFARSGSRGTATIMSDTSRQSVLLPPDRRYTAMPKKSLASATKLPDGGGRLRASSPTSPFVVTASPAVLPNASTTLQTSMLSYSSRRKPMSMQQPHLLQHAQRRLSNMNSLSNSISRQSGPANAAAAARATQNNNNNSSNSSAAGFFFSQFFSTPSYPNSAVTATTTATAPAATAAVYASSAHRSTNAVAASSGSDPGEVFQPEMVRQLFTLTGVLREDVARRIFLSLSGQDAAAPPHLSAQGLRSVLQHLDPCGLREGSSVHRGAAAAAVDDAYRAEVQRCYYQQQQQQTTSSASKSTKASSGGAEGVPADASSTLSRLAARREATLRESDGVALDKLVQSLLSRFAFHKKLELNYDEFRLALLYLWNT